MFTFFKGQFHQHSRAAFMYSEPKSAKKTVKLSIFFVLLGSLCVEAAHRTLMKLAPGPGQLRY